MEDLNWKITGIKADAGGAVFQVFWEASKEVNGIIGIFAGGTPLEVPAKKPKDFIKLNDLKEEDIIAWVKSTIEGNEMYTKHINDVIDANIKAQTNQILEGDSLPWMTKEDK